MRRWPALPIPLLATLATVFAATSVLYGALWMYSVRHQTSRVELGFDDQYDESTQAMRVLGVRPGSPAEQAGLKANDRIVAVNGRRLTTAQPLYEVWAYGRPGDAVELTVERVGESKPLVLRGIFRASSPLRHEGLVKTSALQITGSFPVPFLLVGLAVLFLRLNNPNAWLLTLMFGAFIALPDFPYPFSLSPAFRTFGFAYRAIFASVAPPLFYVFFSVFPTRSPLDRRFPWLKWAGIALGIGLALPGLPTGAPQLPSALVRWLGKDAAHVIRLLYVYGFLGLGLVSLVGNAWQADSPEARRKIRVILWGTLVGVLPIVIERAAIDFTRYRPSFWVDWALIVLLFLFPLSFAYAVVKHRVLEIPVLLKRSARYVLVQRGFILLLVIVAATAIVLFTHTFSRFFQNNSNIGMAVSAVFGIALVWASAPLVKRGTERIDQAFFRSAYDARVILQNLADRTRTVTDRHDLGSLLEQHIKEALHPNSFAGYLEAGDSELVTVCGTVPSELRTISAALPVLAELTHRGKSWDVPPLESGDATTRLSPLRPECLVPILGRDSRLIGLLVLGSRLSEEPYSRGDKDLLDAVANQAGIALESLRLAEKMAERMEAERRAAHEMEIAREVQAHLFPQRMPELKTLEYAGGCLQAYTVGGDYYDFLDLGPGRLGFVLADISGKGISGALLMANLQANLRSHYGLALEDLPRLLRSVNRLFYENTPENCYATLFFANYDDTNRQLRYVNCGHNPPLLLRTDGTLDRLCATATVLGLFPEWECSIGEVVLRPGDVLAIYTDGITEASDSTGQEFGEVRLIQAIRSQRQLPPSAQIANIYAAVKAFSGDSQADDLTLVIARAR